MSTTSPRSGLQFEISRCSNALNSLTLLKANVVTAVDELVEKTAEFMEQARALPPKDAQQNVYKKRLQNAYKLLQEYQSQLDSGPWKFGEDLETYFANEVEDASSISVAESLKKSFKTTAPAGVDTNAQLGANAVSVRSKAKNLSVASTHGGQFDLKNFDSDSNNATQNDIDVNNVAVGGRQRLTVENASSSVLESGASGDGKTSVIVKFSEQPASSASKIAQVGESCSSPPPAARAALLKENASLIDDNNLFDSDEEGLADFVEHIDVVETLHNELLNQKPVQGAAAAVAQQPVGFDDQFLSDSETECSKIDRWNLSDAGPYSEPECEVSYVESPSAFWCRNRPCIVNDIEVELRDSLLNLDDENRVLKKSVRGEYCVVPSPTGYRRGRILEFKLNNYGIRFVKVLYIDYGNKAWVSAERLYVLPVKLFHYQWQASLCILYGLEPVDGDKWGSDAVQKFSQFCESQDLSLILMNMTKPLNNIYTVKLLRRWTISGESDEPAVENVEYADDRIFADCPADVLKSDKVPAPRFLCNLAPAHACSPDPPDNPEPWQIEFVPFESIANDAENSSDEEEGDLTTVGLYRNVPNVAATSARPVRHAPHHNRVQIEPGYSIPMPELHIDKDNMTSFRMETVLSPAEFYVLPRHPDPQRNRTDDDAFRQFTEQLTQFYAKDQHKWPIESNTSSNGDGATQHQPYAVAQLSGDYGGRYGGSHGEFYRCKIMRTYFPESQQQQRGHYHGRSNFLATDIRQTLRADVLFIDLGVPESKLSKDVFYLDARFCNGIPARIVSCSLFGVKPIFLYSGFGDDANAAFKSLCKSDQEMTGMVLNDDCGRYEIVLYGCDASGVSFTINEFLVDHNYGKSDVNWVRARDVTTKTLQRLNRRFKQPVSTTHTEVDQLFNDDDDVPGPSTRFSNVFPVQQQEQRAPFVPKCVEPPEKNSLVDASLGYLTSCVQFSLCFPKGTLDVRKMRTDAAMQMRANKCKDDFERLTQNINDPALLQRLSRSKPRFSTNQYCLARFSYDGDIYRAKIISCLPGNEQFEVMFIDYGNSEYCKLDDIFPILNEHLQFPVMALECHLANVKPTAHASLAQNKNSLYALLSSKELKAKIVDVIQRPSNYPLLMVDLRASEQDGSFISVNTYVVENGWAAMV